MEKKIQKNLPIASIWNLLENCLTNTYFVFLYLNQNRGKRLLNLSFKVYKGEK